MVFSTITDSLYLIRWILLTRNCDENATY